MDYKFLFKRLLLIVFKPAEAWEEIKSGEETIKITRNYFLLPFSVLAAIAAFLGSILFTDAEFTLSYHILAALKFLFLPGIVVYCSAVIIKEITYPLDLGRSFPIAFQLVSYSLIPFFICLLISNVFESLIFINIIGLFGLNIFWTGAATFLAPPEHKRIPLVIASLLVIATLWISFSWLLSMFVERIYS